MRFVVTTPVAASDVPWPVNELPPEEDAVLSALARMTACSTALTNTLAAVTVALSMAARTWLRTSLSTTRPPIVVDGDCVMLNPCGKNSVANTGFQ